MHALAAKLIRMLYALCAWCPLQSKVTLFSRQGKNPSLDYLMLSELLREQCPDLKIKICVTDPESVDRMAFLVSIPVMVYHAATSRVCVLEGYIPAVSIPKLREETCVIQLWHALGAIKKFGFQSIGTAAGRSVEAAETLGMHKNYNWIIAAGPGATLAYAEAFGYSPSAVKPLGMPRMDYLLEKDDSSFRMQKAEGILRRHPFLGDERMKVLYAPTLRQDRKGWLSEEVANLAEALCPLDCVLVVTGHPLELPGACEPNAAVRFVSGARSIDLLEFADVVVTDYSAVAFEAALLGKPVMFYVPDIAQYRVSPGLNIDPMLEFPEDSFSDAGSLTDKLAAYRKSSNGGVPQGAFAEYASRYLADVEEGSTQRLVAFIKECYRGTFRLESAGSNALVDKGEAKC